MLTYVFILVFLIAVVLFVRKKRDVSAHFNSRRFLITFSVVAIIILLINLFYLFLAETIWWVSDDYALFTCPMLIMCTAGSCGKPIIVMLMLMWSIIVGGITGTLFAWNREKTIP